MVQTKSIEAFKKEIIEIGQRTVREGYVTTVGGNISVRLNDEQFLITASTIPLDELNMKNILLVNGQGICSEPKKPSKETYMHLAIYQKRPDISAILHVHPLLSTTLASIGEPITPITFEEQYFLGKTIGFVNQFAAGSNQLSDAVSEEAKQYNVVIMKNHGCVALGGTLKEAFFRVVKLERAAQATIIAKIFGKTIEPFEIPV